MKKKEKERIARAARKLARRWLKGCSCTRGKHGARVGKPCKGCRAAAFLGLPVRVPY